MVSAVPGAIFRLQLTVLMEWNVTSCNLFTGVAALSLSIWTATAPHADQYTVEVFQEVRPELSKNFYKCA